MYPKNETMGDVGFRIRVTDALRSDFISACRARDLTAAQVLREFMRWYVAHSQDAAQLQLFTSAPEAQMPAFESTTRTPQ